MLLFFKSGNFRCNKYRNYIVVTLKFALTCFGWDVELSGVFVILSGFSRCFLNSMLTAVLFRQLSVIHWILEAMSQDMIEQTFIFELKFDSF